MGRVVCPRCGKIGYLVIHCTKYDNKEYCYWRVEHIEKFYGRRKKTTCYLGPKGTYTYVEKVHKLGLTNIFDQDISMLIYNAIMSFIDRAMRSNDKEKVLEEIEKIKKKLVEIQALLQIVEEELRG